MRNLYTLFFILSFLTSCTLQNALKPARQSGFIEYKDDNLYNDIIPFDYVWSKKKRNEPKQNFSKISLKIYGSEFLEKSHWKDSKSVAITNEEEYLESVENIKNYFVEYFNEFLKEESKKENKKLELVDPNTNEDFRLELAFTEISFGHPLFAGSTLLIPLPFASYLFDSVSSPYAAFEAKVINNKTGEVRVMFADKKFPKVKIIDFNKLRAESSVKEITEIWSREIVKSFLANTNEEVDKEARFSLLPW